MKAYSGQREIEPAPSLDMLLRIDDICARFEAVWAAGGVPSLESCLTLVPEALRGRLLGELLRSELELRAKRGDRVSAESLRARFPHDADIVDLVLAERTANESTGAFPRLTASYRGPGAASTRVNAPGVTTMHQEAPERPPSGGLPAPVEGYEILKELGRGGMGVVYLARHLKLQRLVALKVIIAGELSTPAQQDRFRAEALAVARLKHPNLVQIYAGGKHNSQAYLALEYVEGGSLDERLAGQPQPPRAAAWFLDIVARAVHAVHLKGIVHRDLKPANILLEDANSINRPLDHCTPKISDFGLAKDLKDEGDRAVKTRTGAVMGTPAYMSPEQARGDKIGPATDVYALGAILYEMLTGRPPFGGASVMDTLNLICKEEPVSPRRLQANCPQDLETICLKCLEKDPARRNASAQELADDLDAYLRHRPLKARPVGALGKAQRWARRNPVVAGLLALVGLLLVAGAVVASSLALRARHWAEAAESRAEDANRQRDRAEQLAGAESRARLRAEWLAYANQVCLAQREFERGMAPKARMILDGCSTAFRAWEHDYLSHLGPNSRQTLTGYQDLSGLLFRGFPPGFPGQALSPGGHRLAVCVDQEIQVWSTKRHVLLQTLRGHAGTVRCVVYSPDGKRLVSGSDDTTVKVWQAADGYPLLTLEGHRTAVRQVAFSQDGHRLASADAEGVVQVWNAQPVRNGASQ